MSIKRPPSPPNTPTRADASAWTASQFNTIAGLSPLTNNKIGLAALPAKTNKTKTTGGVI